ncbi:MAG: VCBS repeat-containing protein [Flavobacteriales bacterium]|nr:VCBS repeat-containing protein [Flavobacteriales bacterium]
MGLAQNGCLTALPISAGIHTVDTVAGPEIPNPLCAPNGLGNTSASQWYLYTPAEDLSMTITTDLGQTVDTRFHIYTGACGSLTCVGGDDDSGSGLTSTHTMNVTGGVTYRIAFDNRWTSNGFDFQLIENDLVNIPLSFSPTSLGGNIQTVVDMDGDMLDDAVATSTNSVTIFKQQVGDDFLVLTRPTPAAVNSPSWSIAAGDLDGNGYTDLVYGGGSGASIMMASDDGTEFTQVAPPQYIFSQRTNMVDINNDGILDVFVCHDVAPNVYFLHDGNGNFAFNQGGLGPNGGNYGSIWTDVDNDGDVDMFIAKCGSSPPDILMRNNGDGTFTDIAPMLGLADGQQSWSSAWGDFDNDGDMDILVGSSSSGYHKLMRNAGDGTFTNITPGSGFDTFGGQSIEWTTHDFNNDGLLDILGGGAMMMNTGNMTFAPLTGLPSNGPIGDLNNDGFLDIVNGSTVYMNDGNLNNYLRVHLTGVESNKDGIGARITIHTPMGMQIRDVKSGDGFRYMSTITSHFGLGQDEEVYDVIVRWPSGIVQTVFAPPVNGTIDIVEMAGTVGVEETTPVELNLFPNPVTDVLRVSSAHLGTNAAAMVIDAAGRVVMRTVLSNGVVDVSGLEVGSYTLQVEVAGRTLQRSFTKM